MMLADIVAVARDKTRFLSLEDYIDFCRRYLDFVSTNLQAVIVSQNETQYRFFQYKDDGFYNISRPINSNLMYDAAHFEEAAGEFTRILPVIRDLSPEDQISRTIFMRSIYTIQQSVGAALDALPVGTSNQARKINGDLFERLIKFLISAVNIRCESGTIQIPVYLNDEFQFNMSYQHDLLLYDGDALKIIGSVKTSSKDRVDKIFMDKFLYRKLTETALPHIAIFLNDVQRKKTRKADEYGINTTFLSGHFKVYTLRLNPLDGVYYCDIRPNMQRDEFLRRHIHTIDQLFFTDVWSFLVGDE